MIEQYFEKYDRAILPRAYNHPSFSKKLENSNFQTEIPKEKKHSSFQKSKEKNISDLSSKPKIINQKFKSASKNNISPIPIKKKPLTISQSFSNNKIHFRNIQENDCSKIIDFKLEAKKLRSIYSRLYTNNTLKDKELIKLKKQNEKNGNYLLSIEKMLLKINQKSKDLEINKIRKETENNNNNINLIKLKKKEQKNILMENNCLVKENNKEIIDEIQKLKEFKNNIITLSKQNNLINMQMFETIKKLENLMKDLKLKINERDLKIPIGYNKIYLEAKNSNIEELQNYYNRLLNYIKESIKIKQNEYNILLNVKNEKSDNLMKEIERLKLINEEKDRIIDIKNKEINKIKIEAESIKLKNENNFNKTVKTEQKKSDKKEEEKIKLKNDILTKEMKRSVKNSVKKIKRNFDMKKIENKEFVYIIQSQIED